MPFRSKCVGLNTPSVDGSGAVWAVEEILKGGAVLKGSVAQSSVVHVLRN